MEIIHKGDLAAKTPLGEAVLQARRDGYVEFNGQRRSVTPQIRFYTIIGRGHLETKARYFHEALNHHFGWDQIHLTPIEVTDFAAAMEDLTRLGMRGVTVTLPLKEQAYSYIR